MIPPTASDTYALLAAHSHAVHQQHPGPSHVHMEIGATGHSSDVSVQQSQGIHRNVGVSLGMERPQETGATFSFASSSLSSALTEPVAPASVTAVDQPETNFGEVTGHQAHTHSQSSSLHAPIVRTAEEYVLAHSSMHQQPHQMIPLHVITANPSAPGHDRQHSVHADYSSASPHSSGDTDFPMDDRHIESYDDINMGDVQNMSAVTTTESSPTGTSSADRDAFHAATVLANYLPTGASIATSSRIPTNHEQIPQTPSYTQTRSPIQCQSVEPAISNVHTIEITSRHSSTFSDISSPSPQPTSPQVNRAGDVTAAYLAQLNRRQATRPRIVIETLSDIRATPGIGDSGEGQTLGTGTGTGKSQNPPKLSSKLPVADE